MTSPGSVSRQRDLAERGERLRAQVGRSVDQRPVHALERRVDRQHEQRQVVVDQADPDRLPGVEDVEPAGEPDRPEELGDVALRVEDDQPRVGADQERRPERDDDQQQRERFRRAEVAGHPVGDGVADEDRRERAAGGHDQRVPEDRQLDRVPDGAELRPVDRVGHRGEAALHRDRERGQDRHRREEEDRVVDERRSGQPRRVARLERPPRGGGRPALGHRLRASRHLRRP